MTGHAAERHHEILRHAALADLATVVVLPPQILEISEQDGLTTAPTTKDIVTTDGPRLGDEWITIDRLLQSPSHNHLH